MRYLKEHKTFEEQIQVLKTRGLIISNEDKFKQFLSNVNYYKFSNYLKFFQICDNQYNVDVQEVMDLYYFDRELRNTILLYLEKIEISIKTKIAYVLGEKYGAFGHLSKDTFFKTFNHEDFIFRISDFEMNSKESFIKEYYSKYTDEKHVPIWILVEIIPFGNISKVYQYMQNSDKKEVSDYFDVSKKDFESWLRNITLLRNFCAHNSIIWNKNINPIARKSKKWNYSFKWNRMSGMIFLLHYLVKEINPDFSSKRLYTLLNTFMNTHKDKVKELGFNNIKDIEFLNN